MAWRLAKSLATLQGELDRAYPSRTKPDWALGDASHQARPSDHNPNAAGVVCAIDIRQGGIDLAEVAEQIRRNNPRPVKYVIYNRRIWSRARNAEGWRRYTGPNPHTAHMHVSVGVGPDGRSTGPYDDTSSWGIAARTGGLMALPRKGDEGDEVEVVQRMLAALGYDIGEDSAGKPLYDGIYGDATERAVKAFRNDHLSGDDWGGASVTPWTFYRLVREVGALDGGKPGPRGPAGPPGPPGKDGKTPTKISISGDVIEVE